MGLIAVIVEHFAGPAAYRMLTGSGMPAWIREHPHTTAALPYAVLYVAVGLLFSAVLRRDGTTRYSLSLIDLDEFKPVNDRFGHAAGDAVLTAVGQRIAHWTAPEEVAARLGGDEFVVLARRDPRVQDRLTALRTAIRAPVTHQGVSLTVGVPLGTARVTRSHDLSAALGRADQKMDELKGRGRGGRTRRADTARL